jgi:tetratricopeptide (TPR) repeat protein
MFSKVFLQIKLTGVIICVVLSESTTVAESKPSIEQKRQIITVTQSNKAKAETYAGSAQENYRKQDYQGALNDINRAIQLDPNSSFAYAWRCFLKADKFQDNRGALADVNRSIQLTPNNSWVYFMRGNLKTNKLQDIRGGLDDYNRAIQLYPENAIAYSYRATLKSGKLQDHRGALADFDRAIQIEPNYAVAYYNRAILKHDLLKDSAGGIADMQQTIKLYQQQGLQGGIQEAKTLLKKWQETKNKSSLS